MSRVHASTRISDLAVALRHSRELIRRDRWTPEQLHAYQRARLTEVVRHAIAHSAFYRDRYAGVDTGGEIDLRRLRPVDKATVMENFDDLITDPRLRWWISSATERSAARRAVPRPVPRGRHRRQHRAQGRVRRRPTGVAAYLAGLLRANAYLGLRPHIPRRRRVATVAAGRPQHVSYRMSRSLDVGLHRVLRLDATTPVESLVGPSTDISPSSCTATRRSSRCSPSRNSKGGCGSRRRRSSRPARHIPATSCPPCAQPGTSLVPDLRDDRGSHPGRALLAPHRTAPLRGPRNRRGGR